MISGIPLLYSSVTPVVLRQWLILFPLIPACLYNSFFCNMSLPTGTEAYQGALGSAGTHLQMMKIARMCHVQMHLVVISICNCP